MRRDRPGAEAHRGGNPHVVKKGLVGAEAAELPLDGHMPERLSRFGDPKGPQVAGRVIWAAAFPQAFRDARKGLLQFLGQPGEGTCLFGKDFLFKGLGDRIVGGLLAKGLRRAKAHRRLVRWF